jgi:hypothetical protein
LNDPRTIVKRAAIGAALALVFLYLGDALWVRLRMIHPKPGEPFESVTAPRVLAIPQKSGKTEYELDAQNPEQTLVCVHSLFPHDGRSPCWYLKPRIIQPVPMLVPPPGSARRRGA